MAEAADSNEATASRARRTTKAAPVKSPPKTAVVVVHGMGEQRPLETIRSFVEGVYQRDLSKAKDGVYPPSGKLEITIVPDSAFNSAELRRLSTQGDGPAKRTDFFEFYWADIMDGTPVEMVTSWIEGLLLREPWRVPMHLRVWLAWLLLWGLALTVVIAAVATAYPQLADHLWFLSAILDWLMANRQVVGAVVGGIGLIAGVYKVARGLLGGPRKLETTRLMGPAVFVVGGAALLLWPTEVPIDAHFVAAGVTAGVAWFMHYLVAPYLGDVVRYVRATPSTVERRKLVRERGLALLEAIHAKRADSSDEPDFVNAATSSPPAYDRIVLVGHSLGTYVAYDMLQMFWEKYGPTHHQAWQPGGRGMQKALEAVDDFVKAEWVDGNAGYELKDYLEAQETLRGHLRKADPHWRISDLITLGSPLVHAEFLATDGRTDLAEGFTQRRFAACPPRPDPLQKSMLYSTVPGGPKYPHFAAQFAAVKWTNICDESVVPLLGDLVSGKLRPIFGHGIEEHPITITRPGLFWPLNRIFTHTQYWAWDNSYADRPPDETAAEEASDDDALTSNLPEHLRVLRNALKLGE